jgi:hypothetical protein
MRPLYIDGVAGMEVDYDEPALAVSAPGKARQLFPLPRVSRIVVTGSVDWSMPALFACADAGVAIVFLSTGGEVRGRWLGCVRHRQNLSQLFSDFWQRADALERYQDWFAGMERMAVRSSARRLGFVDWQEADATGLSSWFAQSQSRLGPDLAQSLAGFLLATVLHALGDAGLDARSDCLLDEQVDFAADLRRLLLWDFYPALSAWRGKCLTPPDHQALIGFYESRSQRTESLLRSLLNKWHRYLLGLS